MGPQHRLAVYGTLAPGEVNHDQLAGLDGEWFDGTVRGHLHEEGWGATIGFPAIVPDPDGPEVAVRVFESPDLPLHWERLDRFEGSAYHRIVTAATVDGRPLPVYVYALRSIDESVQAP
jgi:gamma-glutamylcyclotransferase (GGCT)/AIG2-like uncharacterized protein YtfP